MKKELVRLTKMVLKASITPQYASLFKNKCFQQQLKSNLIKKNELASAYKKRGRKAIMDRAEHSVDRTKREDRTQVF